MSLIDTHCHIHSPEFFKAEEAEQALKSAVEKGIQKVICVATSLEDSKAAIAFAQSHPDNCWATIGIHPHEAASLTHAEAESQLTELAELADNKKVIGVGETGFDFYYNQKKEVLARQQQLLRGQLEIAQTHDLPLSFHVRDGFDEFWDLLKGYPAIRGVLHSFTDSQEHAQKALTRGLYFGVNGIATFTTHAWQRELFKSLPLENIVLETDAPFLTPKPKRGTMNLPENVIYITSFMAELRGDDESNIARHTTANARKLFGFF